MANKKVEFDEYASTYAEILQNDLKSFGGDIAYYANKKICILKKYLDNNVKSILEYGCGVATLFPSLHKEFPNARLFGCDVSEKSLQIAETNNSYATFFHVDDRQFQHYNFDVILLINVLHHVQFFKRRSLLLQLNTILSPDGMVVIIEHNPHNPLVRRVVGRSPLDTNAELLTLRGARGLLGGMRLEASGYFLFFPALLAPLAPLDDLLAWLPLGGQYYALARKQDVTVRTGV